MKRAVVGMLALAAAAPRAHADGEGTNVLVGPVFGIQLGGDHRDRGTIGVEGGVGVGPERINLGTTRRRGKRFTYLELDAWYYGGASLGLGVDSDGEAHPVLGLWEGVPLIYPWDNCNEHGWAPVLTISVGYRYTGVHELYFAPKAGAVFDGSVCFD